MNEKDEDILIGGILQAGYETIKANLKTEKNESIFDFVETVGDVIREKIEDKNQELFKGADFVKKGKEFWDAALDIWRK